MRALLDVNVLVALLDPDHSLHRTATEWFSDHVEQGWASCPVTRNGCTRVMCGAGYHGALPAHAVIERLATATQTQFHEFWPDDVTLLDPKVADSSRIHGPKQVTDLYLLALAVKRRGRFVTFDRHIPTDAISGGNSHLYRL